MRRRKDAVSIEIMRQIKNAIDPNGTLNPGKLLP
jgi:FAD/FMN-containing dehydrogenase